MGPDLPLDPRVAANGADQQSHRAHGGFHHRAAPAKSHPDEGPRVGVPNSTVPAHRRRPGSRGRSSHGGTCLTINHTWACPTPTTGRSMSTRRDPHADRRGPRRAGISCQCRTDPRRDHPAGVRGTLARHRRVAEGERRRHLRHAYGPLPAATVRAHDGEEGHYASCMCSTGRRQVRSPSPACARTCRRCRLLSGNRPLEFTQQADVLTIQIQQHHTRDPHTTVLAINTLTDALRRLRGGRRSHPPETQRLHHGEPGIRGRAGGRSHHRRGPRGRPPRPLSTPAGSLPAQLRPRASASSSSTPARTSPPRSSSPRTRASRRCSTTAS